MEDINSQVLQGFKLKLKTVQKSKYMYICKTDRGVRLVKPTSLDTKKILTIHIIKEHLYSQGFLNLARYHISEQGTPYFSTAQGTYVMTDYMPYPEIDICNKEDVLNSVRTIALFHKLSCNAVFPDEIKYSTDSLSELYAKKLKRLKSLKKFAANQRHLSDFDVAFIKSYERFCGEAEASLKTLNDLCFDSLCAAAEKNKMVCHNNLKEDNILKSPDLLYITNFDSLDFAHSILDLSAFIRRYIRKHGEDYLDINEILWAYTSINPLSAKELDILNAVLKFPIRYIKICDSFYTKRRTWTPNCVASRFNDLLNLKPHYDEYISKLQI